MTLEDIISKSKKNDVIQFTTRSNRYSPERNLRIISVVGDKVMSKDLNGKLYFNRLDYMPLRYMYNPLPF